PRDAFGGTHLRAEGYSTGTGNSYVEALPVGGPTGRLRRHQPTPCPTSCTICDGRTGTNPSNGVRAAATSTPITRGSVACWVTSTDTRFDGPAHPPVATSTVRPFSQPTTRDGASARGCGSPPRWNSI